MINPLREVEKERLHEMKLLQCRFYAVLDMRGKVPGRMDLFLGTLISRKWTELCKVNYPNVLLCAILN